MPETLTTPSPVSDTEAGAEAPRRIAGFKTAKGSIYSYDSEGKTTRFKTATGEQHERQDITVFLPLEGKKEEAYMDALNPHLKTVGYDRKVYIVERQPHDTVTIVRDVSQVKNPDRVYLGILRFSEEDKSVAEWERLDQVSLTPVAGYNVFDTRQFEEDGKTYTDRHIGNKVTEILYEP